MDIKLILVSAIMVILVFLPFVLLPLLQNKDNKKLGKKFRKEEKNHNLNIGLNEEWSQNAIGIDPEQKKLLFVQKSDDGHIVECIDLNTVHSCIPLIDEITIVKNGKKETLLKRVSFNLAFKNTEIKKEINLFDYDLHVSQDLEVQHAQKWAGLIKQQLSNQPVYSKTA
ncbi:hypothetical protein BH23BAC2_BH23BAC2_06620 [soil metagenome]